MHLEKIDSYRWLIPRTYKPGMRTDTLIYANERLLEAIRQDQSLEQAANIAMLPGIVGRALAMPDIHQGYGFPIGGVAAVDEQEGVVSPGGVGFDINCGVRLLSSTLTLVLLLFAVTTSLRPSPLKSPVATATGFAPTV